MQLMQCCNTNSCHTECLVERVFVLLVQSYETDLILIYQILSILITRNLWRDNHLPINININTSTECVVASYVMWLRGDEIIILFFKFSN